MPENTIGVCIAANKEEGARVALCSNAYSTERSIKSNDANIMTFGALVTGPELAKSLVRIWLQSEFDKQSASAPKVQRIIDYDRTKDR
ncbi:MAG: RpiB/LacA/LacB family sugar-phosphate isomerase [Desulfobulbaceae bacterium]|nr:RpiB/LacA/LacB family sugar-phosphate isomerase [Desulfobulbaceae bacterium]